MNTKERAELVACIESAEFTQEQWEALRPAAPAQGAHDCYVTADADRPASILDRNGEVVLLLCRRCGKGEAELDGPCLAQGALTDAEIAALLGWSEREFTGLLATNIRAAVSEATRREREKARVLVNAEIADAWQRAHFDPHIFALGIEAEVVWREKERARGLVEALEAFSAVYGIDDVPRWMEVRDQAAAALATYRSQS